MTDKNILQTIAFDKQMYDSLMYYNKTYANGVNAIIEELKSLLPDLTDDDVNVFLSNPQTLIARYGDEARAEYENYVNSLPRSVKASLSFSFPIGEQILKLYKKIPKPTSFLSEKFIEIKNGKASVDEEGLRQRCTICGSIEVLKIWQKTNEMVVSLNALQKELRHCHGLMKVIEDEYHTGLIHYTSDGYVANIERLRLLI